MVAPVKFQIAAVLTVLTAAPAFAQGMDGHAGHHMAADAEASVQVSAQGTGVIRKLDAKTGAITLQHAPIPALGWPAMTMPFQAKPELLAGLKVGQAVTFTVEAGEPPLITAIKP